LQAAVQARAELGRELQAAQDEYCRQQDELEVTRSQLRKLELLCGEKQRLTEDLQTATDVKMGLTRELCKLEL
jgi:hypothetical protein